LLRRSSSCFCKEDDVDVGSEGLGRAQELDARQPRHLQVAQDEIEPAILDVLEGGSAVRGEDHAIACARQRALETLAQAGIVVRDEERRRLRHVPLA
jgi:hypothetical protein